VVGETDNAMHRTPLTFARFLPTPENRSALLATQEVAETVCRRRRPLSNPLFLHGPTGTGKTHLVSALAEQVTHRCPDLVVTVLAAGDLHAARQPALASPGPAAETRPEEAATEDVLGPARSADLLIVEDLQHLPSRAVEALVGLLDARQARGRQTVCTAGVGPQELDNRQKRFPGRLTSRLAAGLVVRLEPLQATGRLALLQDQAARRRLAVGPDVLAWLAEHLTGGARQLLGALTQLETLARLGPSPLDVEAVAVHFRAQALASAVSVEQIARRVGGYFQVEPEQLQSRCRYRSVLLPRQVGMYLARQLTTLSLEQIGAYFGGRDHSTVLHACRKVERALTSNAVLSGAVRQLHADLA
jgi:chromosomal replication initiator protein